MRAGFSAILVSALVLFGAAHLALRRHAATLPLMSDEGEYTYQARLLENGGLPYRDAVNQKPPLVFFAYRAATTVFGWNERAPRKAAYLISLLLILGMFLLTPEAWRAEARLAAPGLWAVLSTLPVGDFAFAFNTEALVCAFAVPAAWAALQKRPGWSGLASGAAFMSKQTALPAALAFAAFAVWDAQPRERRAAAARFAAGFVCVPALLFGYFAARGGLGAMFADAYEGNFHYAAAATSPQALALQLKFLFATLLPRFLPAAFVPAGLAILGLAGLTARRRNRVGVLAAGWLGGAAVGASAGFLFFPHYFLPVVPPLALSAALGVERLKIRTLAAAALALALVLPPAAHARIYFHDAPRVVARKLLHPNPLFEAKAVGEWIRAHSDPDDRLYVFGSEPHVYVYAQRACATRHIFVYPLTLFPKGMAVVEDELAALADAPPAWIVLSEHEASTLISGAPGAALEEGILGMLERSYEEVPGPPREPGAVLRLFRLTDGPGS